ncbi:MAG TPA: sigma-70 family RNA polymerase sigma factor [Candidatus Polarisedimenticolia bacterium]|nr:sigma-70 family RNA polymerase sigma factor [Candidatus Polarisedimenticolia bacterium]
MTAGDDLDGQIASFLSGESSVVACVRAAIDSAVRAFRFPDAAVGTDLCQDALARVFVNLRAGRFRGESSLATYARRVARYTCLEHIRRRRDQVPLDLDTVPSATRWSEPESSLLWAEEHLRNVALFSSLPAACRELLKMIFLDGLSYRQAARALGVTEGTIKTRVHRCRACLRQASRSRKPAHRLARRARP